MEANFLRSRLRKMPRLKALIKEGIRIAERLPRVTAGSNTEYSNRELYAGQMTSRPY